MVFERRHKAHAGARRRRLRAADRAFRAGGSWRWRCRSSRSTPAQMARLKASFAKYLTFLTEDRTALLARDAKNHHASAWLLQVAAFARLTGNDDAARGVEPPLQEHDHPGADRLHAASSRTSCGPATPTATRCSTWTCWPGSACCLSSRFDSLWDHELQDGPGMRTAIAYSRAVHPQPQDVALPGGRRALQRAALPAAGAAVCGARVRAGRLRGAVEDARPGPRGPGAICATFPIRQPLLWQTPGAAPRRSKIASWT